MPKINNYATLEDTKNDGDFKVDHSSKHFYSIYNTSVSSKEHDSLLPTGWKFHIGIDDSVDSEGKQSNLEKGWMIVSDILSKYNVRTWKVVKPNQNFSEVKNDPTFGEVDQRGKQITIHAYLDPHDEDPVFWQKVLQEIETALRLNNIIPNVPNNEQEISLTGSQYIRYRQDGMYRKDKEGYTPAEDDPEDAIALVENRTKHPNPSNLSNPYGNIQLHPPTYGDRILYNIAPAIDSLAFAYVNVRHSVGQFISNSISSVRNTANRGWNYFFGANDNTHNRSSMRSSSSEGKSILPLTEVRSDNPYSGMKAKEILPHTQHDIRSQTQAQQSASATNVNTASTAATQRTPANTPQNQESSRENIQPSNIQSSEQHGPS